MNKIIYVVEGRHDKDKLLKIDDTLFIVETNGSCILKETIDTLIKYENDYKIVLILDPDYQGERIRRVLNEKLKSPINIYLDKKECINKKRNKVGLEHASIDYIKSILNNYICYDKDDNYEYISKYDLYELGFTDNLNSLEKREYILNKLNIGKSNFKAFHKRLNSLKINKEKLKEMLVDYEL